MIKRFGFIFLLMLSFFSKAQENGPEMADTFRSDGKIYVVISVIGLIFLSIVIFLIYIERKLKKLEDQLDNKK